AVSTRLSESPSLGRGLALAHRDLRTPLDGRKKGGSASRALGIRRWRQRSWLVEEEACAEMPRARTSVRHLGSLASIKSLALGVRCLDAAASEIVDCPLTCPRPARRLLHAPSKLQLNWGGRRS